MTAAGSDEFTVTGELAMHGVTKRIDLPVSYVGLMRDLWGNEKAGFEAAIRLARKDFGLSWNAALEAGGSSSATTWA